MKNHADTNKQVHVLIVEDNDMQSFMLRRMVEQELPAHGFGDPVVTIWSECDTVINQLDSGQLDADVIILDIGLPCSGDEDGDPYDQGIRALKALLKQGFKVVVVTAIQVPGFQRLAERSGIEEVYSIPALSKPFFREDLVRKLTDVLGAGADGGALSE